MTQPDPWMCPDAYPIAPITAEEAAHPPADPSHPLVMHLANQLQDLSLETIQRVLSALPRATARALVERGAAEIPGVVHVYLRELPATRARNGVNPYTGGPMMKPAMPKRSAVTFRSFLGRELGEWEPIV